MSGPWRPTPQGTEGHDGRAKPIRCQHGGLDRWSSSNTKSGGEPAGDSRCATRTRKGSLKGNSRELCTVDRIPKARSASASGLWRFCLSRDARRSAGAAVAAVAELVRAALPREVGVGAQSWWQALAGHALGAGAVLHPALAGATVTGVRDRLAGHLDAKDLDAALAALALAFGRAGQRRAGGQVVEHGHGGDAVGATRAAEHAAVAAEGLEHGLGVGDGQIAVVRRGVGQRGAEVGASRKVWRAR